ncbi:MAG: hypothetical protein WD397_03015 [Wenzhouxiangellaceae bacterium]
MAGIARTQMKAIGNNLNMVYPVFISKKISGGPSHDAGGKT